MWIVKKTLEAEKTYCLGAKVPSRNEFDLAVEYNFHSAATTLPATWKHDECPDDFLFHAVTEQEIGKVIKGLSLNKAPGLDKITASVLKDSLPAILSIITSIMSNSLSTSRFPKAWKMAEVVPSCVRVRLFWRSMQQPAYLIIAYTIQGVWEVSLSSVRGLFNHQ